jgi:hypothetical protein
MYQLLGQSIPELPYGKPLVLKSQDSKLDFPPFTTLSPTSSRQAYDDRHVCHAPLVQLSMPCQRDLHAVDHCGQSYVHACRRATASPFLVAMAHCALPARAGEEAKPLLPVEP